MSHRSRALPRTQIRRAVYSLILVVVILLIGTAGFHAIEGAGLIDAFYFESMLATGQGPPFPLQTDTGKIFASIMAFVSVGSVVTSFVFTLGPIAGRLWREGLERIEAGARELETDVVDWERRR
jgi:hypothetical protein